MDCMSCYWDEESLRCGHVRATFEECGIGEALNTLALSDERHGIAAAEEEEGQDDG